jgi:hypothetical protein
MFFHKVKDAGGREKLGENLRFRAASFWRRHAHLTSAGMP